MIKRAFVTSRARRSRSQWGGARRLRRAPAGDRVQAGQVPGQAGQAGVRVGAPWNGNKTEWELALANRNQNQNEYKRTR